ncbi:hypothetical protein A8709_21480 [Paenibacillus pectinilyticus]|uniref:SGNH hydrolase-type esterase domain-containing protein n=1 Tax=Paenibacillus pectinilyticus TaxID=512399 RepID=A0A1C0ZXP1_9BACL|nr:SGNH/GDSL hydrolase family protein [Paenibacillus pectinilyticus]OCT12905.1 hypothetical protein A8709_21480 [Paenibacillus pectinilyticus]
MYNINASKNGAMKLRGGLPHMNDRLLRNDHIVVAFLGGSITEGAGASDLVVTSWRALTEKYLKDRYSHEKVTCINAGVGGTTSTFGAHRLHEHVLSKGEIDLLFVEFSVNDGEDREESIRGMEGIVRQCKRLSPRTDICFIYTAADKNLTEGTPFNIAVHEEVAAYYAIPSISFASIVYELMNSKQVRWEDLASDRVHPNDAGHALYAEFLREYLDAVLNPNAVTVHTQGNALVLPPLNPQNYEYAEMLDVDRADHLEGFVRQQLTSEPLMNWRYETEHLFTDTYQASLTFTVEGQGAGVLMLWGPDSGIIEYAVDGLPFEQVNLFDEWCLKAFRPIIAMLPVQDERRSRRVTIRHTGLKDERSLGTSLRILRLLCN